MQIVTCVSYYGSGSSAIIDLLSEYEGIKSLTNYEFRFAHDPDGLSELEYNLVENFNRHNSGHALKRYRKMVDYYGRKGILKTYEPYFDNCWKKYSYDYIDALTDFSYEGYWQYDFYDKGPFLDFMYKLPGRILHRTLWRKHPERNFKVLKEVTLASHPTEAYFLECTRNYTDRLLHAANKENLPIVLVDQILPSSNIKRHMRYFNNIKAIVVDRDPRDIYLLAKYEWNDNIVPKEIDVFCKWYEYTRCTQHEELKDNENVMLIQFEDLIYDYENVKKQIIEWIGIDEGKHIEPRKYFDPKVSEHNTRYWVSHPECKREADLIARNLSKYIYEFKDNV